MCVRQEECGKEKMGETKKKNEKGSNPSKAMAAIRFKDAENKR